MRLLLVSAADAVGLAALLLLKLVPEGALQAQFREGCAGVGVLRCLDSACVVQFHIE